MENIVYDIDELKIKLEQNLDTLDRIRYNDKYSRLLGAPFMDGLTRWARSIRRQKDLPFTVVVCGEFKRGKSSLINALLADDVVVTDVTPETITLNRISYGEHSNALVLPGGKRMLLSDEQLRRENLEAILEAQGQGACQLEIRRPIELLKSITIVDTPGMEDAMEDYSPMVIEALNQADAVLHVFSVNYPLSKKEQLFIRSVLLPQKHTSVMMIGNFADMLQTESGCMRMRREVEKRLEGILDGVPFFMLSALDERCRQMNTERPAESLKDILQAEFQKLRDSLSELIQEKGNMVLPDRMERMFRGMMDDLGSQLDALEHGVTVDQQALSQEKEAAERACEAMRERQGAVLARFSQEIQQMRLETQEWLFELLRKMREEADGLQDADTLDVRKFYSIYCVDTLQDALTRCVDCHLDAIYDEIDGISGELSRELAAVPDRQAKQNFRFALHNKTWTKGDNVYLGSRMFSRFGLVGGLLSSVAAGVAGHMRGKELAGKKDTVLQDVQEQYAQLEKALPGILKRNYDQIEQQLYGQIQDYFASQIQAAEANTAQMAQIANRDVEEKQQIHQAICEVRAMLEDMIA